MEECNKKSDAVALTGVVNKVYGAYYNILPLPGMERELRGKLRGKLRLTKGNEEFYKFRHLIHVGDHVRYTIDENDKSDQPSATIIDLIPRTNSVYRSSPVEIHPLGANLDRAVLVVSYTQPSPNFHFIDRFIASCHVGGVVPILVSTKEDLIATLDKDELNFIFKMQKIYESLGYSIFSLSLTHDEQFQNHISGKKELLDTLSQGVTLLAGRSGTGKSTLLNLIFGYEVQKTSAVSETTHKGKHTTTNSSLYRHPSKNALVIDTPGIKEWGINHLTRQDIFESFPEFDHLLDQCKYRGCTHDEMVAGCAIQSFIKSSLEKVTSDENTTATENTTPDTPSMSPDRIHSLHAMFASMERDDRIRTGDYIKPTGRLRKNI